MAQENSPAGTPGTASSPDKATAPAKQPELSEATPVETPGKRPGPPPMDDRRLGLRLKVVGAVLAIIGAMYVMQFGTGAFTYTKEETWNTAPGGSIDFVLVGAPEATLELTYFDGTAPTMAYVIENATQRIDATRGHFLLNVTTSTGTYLREIYARDGPPATYRFDVSEQALGYQLASPSPSAYRLFYVFAGVALVIALGGIATFLRVLRPLAMTGAVVMAVSGVWFARGDMFQGLLMAAAGFFALLAIRKSKHLFRPISQWMKP